MTKFTDRPFLQTPNRLILTDLIHTYELNSRMTHTMSKPCHSIQLHIIQPQLNQFMETKSNLNQIKSTIIIIKINININYKYDNYSNKTKLN